MLKFVHPSMKKYWLSLGLISLLILSAFLAGCGRHPETILYHTTDKEGLWSMKPDGSGARQLTEFGWYGEYSPDNSRIAFGKFYADGIWVAAADGSQPVQLAKSGSNPSWSPDGSQLAYNTGGTKGAERRIWIMNADGTNAHQLSLQPGSFPHWSPSSDKIIFHGEVNSGIWLINADGSQETLLYRNGGYPAWSPNGKQIAYVDLTDWHIWVMNADGGEKTALTEHTGDMPAWSADGLQIAYARGGKETQGIWVINADGTDDHRISDNGRHPDWSN